MSSSPRPLFGPGVWSSLWTGLTAGSPGSTPYLGEDGHEHLAEGLEALWPVPDVVHHEVAVLTEAGVVEPLGVRFTTRFFETSMDLLELRKGHVPWMEIRNYGHGSSPLVGRRGRFWFVTAFGFGSPAPDRTSLRAERGDSGREAGPELEAVEISVNAVATG